MAAEAKVSPVEKEAWSSTRRALLYPHQVVSDPHLTLAEKREILSVWASDMNAVESLPALRHLPGTPFPVTYSAIMGARAQLDRIAGFDMEPDAIPPPPRAVLRQRVA